MGEDVADDAKWVTIYSVAHKPDAARKVGLRALRVGLDVEQVEEGVG